MWIHLDQKVEGVQAYYASKEVMNNTISGCGGAGIHLDWGEWPETPAGSRYLHVDTYGNLLVGNEYGIWFDNFESFDESMGANSLTNDTIAFNTVGIQLDGNNAQGNAPNDIQNLIVWDNSTQYVHSYTEGTAWDPEGDGTLENSDWEGLLGSCAAPDGSGNIDCDPDFLGNYDLDTGSPCIDAGQNTHGTQAVAPQYDLDGDLRKVDGDWDCTSREEKVVDMGAQEAPNDC